MERFVRIRMVIGSALLTALTGCSEERITEVELPWQLDFVAAEFDTMTQLGRDCRFVTLLPDELLPVEPPWHATLEVRIERRALAGGRFTTVEGESVHELRMEGLEADSVRLVITGPFEVSVLGRRDLQGGFRGEWTCDESFPFAGNAILVEAGYDPAAVIRGTWALFQIGPSG